jgi:hypothetical protein
MRIIFAGVSVVCKSTQPDLAIERKTFEHGILYQAGGSIAIFVVRHS